jgi:ubiquinone/menaquinone biosynthesis C-methylase UbiE
MKKNENIKSNNNTKSRVLFDRIAWIYNLLDKPIRKTLTPAIRKLAAEIVLDRKRVLDVGTGTGIWADLIKKNGAIVSGVDQSEKMLIKARKRNQRNIDFTLADGLNLTHFLDKSFDIVTSSFVLHGMPADKREQMLAEMKRVSKNVVVILDHDVSGPSRRFFLEWLEKNDLRDFNEKFLDEFNRLFIDCKKIPVKKGSALYIGYQNQPEAAIEEEVEYS